MTAPVPETPETGSVWQRALRAVAMDAGLLRRRRDFRLLVLGQERSLETRQRRAEDDGRSLVDTTVRSRP